MDKFFKISERGSSVTNEILSGLTTFFTMAYIVIVNPAVLTAAGISYDAALTSTCLGAAIATAAMGLIANRPLALASGMGLNAMIAYSLCLTYGVDWRVGMACVFAEGVIILLLVLCGLREAIMRAIPASLRNAISIGIGLFIAFMGLQNGGLVVDSEATLIAFGDITTPVAVVALVAITSAAVLHARNVTGGLLLSILIAAIVGLPLGVTTLPTEWAINFDFSSFAAPFQMTPEGDIAILKVFTEPVLIAFVFSLLMSDFFDTMGTVMGVAAKADFTTEDGFEDSRSILVVDSAAAALGGFVGASSITTYVESAAGAAAGARTGLSSVVVAILFLLSTLLAPVMSIIPTAATSGALVIVGYLMMKGVVDVEWDRVEIAIPSFLIIAGIPLMYSITTGIGLGFIFYCVIMTFMGQARDIKPLMWVTALAFVGVFITSAFI